MVWTSVGLLITSYVFLPGGRLISWKSMLQRTVALSTTEAEYMVAIEATKKAFWLRGLFGELRIIRDKVIIHCDSHNSIYLTRNSVYHERTKYITSSTTNYEISLTRMMKKFSL